MKRASFAQRLAFILFSAALTSIALAAPPEHAQGEPPPFNRENCVFEYGRTTCTTIEESAVKAAGRAKAYRTDRFCADGTTLYEVKKPAVDKAITTITVVYYGASDVIESYEVFTELIDGAPTIVGTMCM